MNKCLLLKLSNDSVKEKNIVSLIQLLYNEKNTKEFVLDMGHVNSISYISIGCILSLDAIIRDLEKNLFFTDLQKGVYDTLDFFGARQKLNIYPTKSDYLYPKLLEDDNVLITFKYL